MNKLVSKNPVLRFKLGRKITFAQLGDKMLYNGNEIVTKEILDGLPIYRRKNGTYIYSNNKLLSPILNNVNNPQLKYNPGWISNIDSLILNNISNILKFVLKPNLKETVTLSKNSVLDINGNKEGNSGKRTSLNQQKGSNNSFKLAFDSARNSGKLEFTWNGKKYNTMKKGETKEQWLFNLRSSSSPELPTFEQLILQVTQNTPVIEKVPQAGTDTILNLLTEMQKVVPATGTYTMKPILPKLNRSDTRWVINDALGKNAYNFTGTLRKALRLYLNGEQYNANDLAAFGDLDIFNKYKSTQSYKQGGNILPSRNIIERFKITKALKGLKTAPKAEDRYKNGTRDSVAYLGVPLKDETYFGESIKRVTTPNNAKILRLVLYRYYPYDNDTIYREVPEHSNRIFFPKVNIKPRLGFSYAKTPEYEILKRRFNTAWNLAK